MARCPICRDPWGGVLLLKTVQPCNRCLRAEEHMQRASGGTAADYGVSDVKLSRFMLCLTYSDLPMTKDVKRFAMGFGGGRIKRVVDSLNTGVDDPNESRKSSDPEAWSWRRGRPDEEEFGYNSEGVIIDMGPDPTNWL